MWPTSLLSPNVAEWTTRSTVVASAGLAGATGGSDERRHGSEAGRRDWRSAVADTDSALRPVAMTGATNRMRGGQAMTGTRSMAAATFSAG